MLQSQSILWWHIVTFHGRFLNKHLFAPGFVVKLTDHWMTDWLIDWLIALPENDKDNYVIK